MVGPLALGSYFKFWHFGVPNRLQYNVQGKDGLHHFVDKGDKRPAHSAKDDLRCAHRGDEMGQTISQNFRRIGPVDLQAEEQIGRWGNQKDHPGKREKPEQAVAQIAYPLPHA